MIEFRPNACAVVAADTKSTIAAMDDALIAGLRMCSSVVEAAQNTALPVGQSQKLYKTIFSGLESVVSGRGEIASAVAQLTVIKKQSNFDITDVGCPAGWAMMAHGAGLDRLAPLET